MWPRSATAAESADGGSRPQLYSTHREPSKSQLVGPSQTGSAGTWEGDAKANHCWIASKSSFQFTHVELCWKFIFAHIQTWMLEEFWNAKLLHAAPTAVAFISHPFARVFVESLPTEIPRTRKNIEKYFILSWSMARTTGEHYFMEGQQEARLQVNLKHHVSICHAKNHYPVVIRAWLCLSQWIPGEAAAAAPPTGGWTAWSCCGWPWAG